MVGDDEIDGGDAQRQVMAQSEIIASADTYLDSLNNGTAFGGGSTVNAGWTGSVAYRSLVTFSLAGLPEGAEIESAILRLWWIDVAAQTAGQKGQWLRLDGSYVEAEATWDSRYTGMPWESGPGGDYFAGGSAEYDVPITAGYAEHDVTSLIATGFAAGNDVSLLFRRMTEGNPNARGAFHARTSATSAYRPLLTVTYASDRSGGVRFNFGPRGGLGSNQVVLFEDM